jgi:hypothetical protein
MLDDTIEAWRPVVGWEDHYAVSNVGRVMRTSGRTAGRFLKLTPGNMGYYNVVLQVGERRRLRHPHHLVADAFLPPRPSARHEVDHIDGDKLNNRVWNLEWVTHQANMQHAVELGLFHDRRGEGNGRALLTEDIVRNIRTLHMRCPASHLAEIHHVSKHAIHGVRSGRTWQHVT